MAGGPETGMVGVTRDDPLPDWPTVSLNEVGILRGKATILLSNDTLVHKGPGCQEVPARNTYKRC